VASRDEQRRNTVTIRWSLIRNLSLLLLFLTGLILLATVYTGREIEHFVSAALIERALDSADSDLHRFFDPVQQGLEVSRRMVRDGSLDLDDAEALDRTFVPLLASVPQISGVNVGDERGRSFLLMRLPDERWRSRVTRVDEWNGRLEFREWSDDGSETRAWSVEEPGEDEAFDPRTRDWYRVAREAAAREEPGDALPRGVYWTQPYSFFSTGEPGITAMVQVEEPRGQRRVLAFDVLLRDLSDFTRNLHVSEHGICAVLAEDGRMLGLPGLPRFDDPAERAAALLARPIESGVPTLSDVALEYRELLPNAPRIFPFHSGGERYWADLREVALGRNAFVSIAVVVPSRDLVGPVNELRALLVGVSILGFAGALAMSVVLARRYSGPLARLAENSERIGSLELDELARVRSSLREVDQLATEQERMRVALDSFSRYVPVDVVRELMRRGEAARLGGARCEVTALFTDIRGFTSIAEGMDPEALTAHLAEYFEELLGIVQGDGFGTVTQLNGDGLVGFWGAPRPDEAHAAHASAAVLSCGRRLAERNAEWARRGRPELHTRFGLASGAAVVGNVGASSRLVYTAIGDTINLASRLEGLGRFYGTSALASDATRAAAGDAFAWRLVDYVRVKGRAEVVGIHELLGAAGGVPEADLDAARRYEAALGLYRERRFAEARAALEALAGERPGDLSVTRLLELARRLERAPPAADWEGVSDYFEK
jgi:adenylate cyclase